MRCYKSIVTAFLILLTLLAFADSVKKKSAKNEAKSEGGRSKDLVEDKISRKGKLFSLFNIVRFRNDPCRSNIVLSGGTTSTRRNGTCFTSSECSSKAGTFSGNCAAGFGVCCVFFVAGSSTTVTQNCTYIQNPGFPSAYSGTTGLSYTVKKCGSDVCYLRLDFESFAIVGTADSVETGGGQCVDMFTVTKSPAGPLPVICGHNTGQHLYIDMGALPGDTVSLGFAFAGPSTSRRWDIKATQIECHALSNRPPQGCLQYETGLTGRFTSFNFLPTSGQTHLKNQKYAVCIRPEEGYCCIEYTPCPDANSFTLDTTLQNSINAGVDIECANDYVVIGESSGICSQGSAIPIRGRYCGKALSSDSNAMISEPICDCTQPFTVEIVTDATPDAVTLLSRGVCLMYMQVACSN